MFWITSLCFFFQDYGFSESEDDDQQVILHYSIPVENGDTPEVVLPSQNVEMIANSNFESVSHIAENIIFPCSLGDPEVAIRENGNNHDEGQNNAMQSRGLLVLILLAILCFPIPFL